MHILFLCVDNFELECTKRANFWSGVQFPLNEVFHCILNNNIYGKENLETSHGLYLVYNKTTIYLFKRHETKVPTVEKGIIYAEIIFPCFDVGFRSLETILNKIPLKRDASGP